MQTRSGSVYRKPDTDGKSPSMKRRRVAVDFFDGLPDDLVLSILCKLISSAQSPSDLVSVMMTCKRMNGLVMNPMVLSKASAKSLAIRAKNWSESAHRFLKLCVDAGCLEAAYTLGMIMFYCLQSRSAGAALMAKAAMGSHAAALYSLAVVQFNGSGGSKTHKDLRAGVALCARAAYLGHVDALRELGHCLQDGYGVRRNVAEGRRFLLQANARELAEVVPTATWRCQLHQQQLRSDFGCDVPVAEPHSANRFMAEWFAGARGKEAEEGGLRLCSHARCGRPETRKHEFRRCSVCGTVNYCSRACQALHWRLAHKSECVPMGRWADGVAAAAAADADLAGADGGNLN
ncbi:MYND finger family protein [Iris pallida]|uniref:MYND finger family protein n=1 Tax=Iris pallida TaxID=29817 RepID=A0AAX6IM87_IRIPA|nr:MYND finger family protein [Iris pallida]